LEVEGAKSSINASIAKRNAETSRILAEQLNAEADAIEASVKQAEAEEEVRKSASEYRKLTPQERYDDERASKKEKDAALQMIAEKRNLAKQEIQNVSDREQLAKTVPVENSVQSEMAPNASM
jgi:hypothetical protein